MTRFLPYFPIGLSGLARSLRSTIYYLQSLCAGGTRRSGTTKSIFLELIDIVITVLCTKFQKVGAKILDFPWEIPLYGSIANYLHFNKKIKIWRKDERRRKVEDKEERGGTCYFLSNREVGHTFLNSHNIFRLAISRLLKPLDIF